MGNSTLDDRAKSLERELSPKLKCYVRVGWMKEPSGSEIYIIYVDQRANIDYAAIPSNWCGNQVDVQLVLPPGVKPPDPFSEPIW